MNFEQTEDRENIIRLLENDDVSRNKYLLSFLKIMNNNGKNKIFSLNGNWGSGKTVFVRKLELLIKYCYMYKDKELILENIYSNTEQFIDDDIEKLENLIKKDTYKDVDKIVKDNLINCVYFNAWEHDDEEDPMISIIYELIKKYNLFDETQVSNLTSVLDAINILAKNVSLGKLDFKGIIEKENLAENIQRKDNIKKAVNSTIDNLINEKCNKLIIFIDELDRCNPNYAVKLLERIKHYFTDERIVIVVSTNLLELANTISGMYGYKFSSTVYLDKFFDIRLELPKINIDKYIQTLDTILNDDKSAWFSLAIDSFIKSNNLQPREINRYLGCIKFFETNAKKDRYYAFDRYQNLIDYLFIPYILGLYITNIEEYNNFKELSGWDNFYKYICDNESLIRLCKYSLYEKNNNEPIDVENETVLKEVNKLYKLMFDNNYKEKIHDVVIGNQTIRFNAFDYIEDKISLLGALSDFGER